MVLGISDHDLIYAARKHSSVKSKPITIKSRIYKNVDETSFKHDIDAIPWQYIVSLDDPISAWQKLFFDIADKHAPVKQRRIRKNCAPWLSVEIKKLIWERDRFKRKAVYTNDENDWVNFKTAKNLVSYKIRDSKKQYYNSLFQHNVRRTKETWNSINSLVSKSKNSTTIPKILQNEIEITDPVTISNVFNKHFTKIGPKLAAQISLGVILSSDLKWNPHIEYIVKKANKKLYPLRVLRRAGVDQKNLLKVYLCSVRPVLEYAVPIWQNIPDYLSNEIESAQKRVLKIIFPECESYAEALNFAQLPTLTARRVRICQKYMAKMRRENHPLLPIPVVPDYDINLRQYTDRSYLFNNVTDCRTIKAQSFFTFKYF